MDSYSVEAVLKASGADQFARSFKDAANSVQGMENSTKGAGMTIGKLVGAIGITAALSKGFNMVKDSVEGAVSRYDTLNNFPRVMEKMGFSTDKSRKSIEKLSDGIDGLPTTLDEVAGTTQRIAVMTGDLDGAVDTTLALNNAFIASGSDSNKASRGFEQYISMLSKGEVDLQSWRTLQETMGLALNDTAKAFGFTGKSAQNDLYKALKDGDITFDAFNSKIIELSTKTGGFADIAREASGGIGVAWTNMKTAIVKGVADTIGAIDKALGGTGEIENIINKMKDSVKLAFGQMVEAVPVVVEKLKEIYDTLEPWMPLIQGVALAIGTFVTALATANSIIKTATSIMKAFNMVLAMNPWVLIAAAIVTAAVLIYVYWEPIKEFFIKLWEKIKEVGIAVWEWLQGVWESAVEYLINVWNGVSEFFAELWDSIKEKATSIWDSVKETWQSTVDSITGIWESVTTFFTDLWDGVKEVSTSVWDGIVEPVKTAYENITTTFEPLIKFFSKTFERAVEVGSKVFDNLVSFLENTWENIKIIAESAWEIIKNVILGPILLLIDLVTGDFEGFKEDLKAIWTNISEAAGEIWNAIKDIVMDYVTTLWESAKEVFFAWVDTVSEAFGAVKETLGNIWDNIKAMIDERLLSWEEAFNNGMDAIYDVLVNAWMYIDELWRNALSLILGDSINNFEEIKHTIEDAMEAVWIIIEAVWDFIKDTFSNAVGFIMALVRGDFGVMAQFIDQQLTLIKDTAKVIWDNIKEIFFSVLKAVWGIVKEKFHQIKQWAIDKLTEAAKGISVAWDNAKKATAEKIAAMLKAVIDKFNEIKQAAKDKMEQARQNIENAWNKAKQFLQNIDLVQIGKDAIQGFINGIKSKIEDVKAAAKSAADAVTGKIKSILKIASPSKLLKRMGSWTGEGFVGGILSMVKYVARASDQLALAAIPDIEPFDIGGQVASINKTASAQMQNTVTSELNISQKQPAKIVLQLGSNDFEAFVDDINSVNAVNATLRRF